MFRICFITVVGSGFAKILVKFEISNLPTSLGRI